MLECRNNGTISVALQHDVHMGIHKGHLKPTESLFVPVMFVEPDDFRRITEALSVPDIEKGQEIHTSLVKIRPDRNGTITIHQLPYEPHKASFDDIMRTDGILVTRGLTLPSAPYAPVIVRMKQINNAGRNGGT